MAFVGYGAVGGRSGLLGGAVASQRPRVAVAAAGAGRVSMAMERTFLVGGNWKCNGSKATIDELIGEFNNGSSIEGEQVEAVLGVPYPYLTLVREKLRKDWCVSAQNSWIQDEGAFTGEVSGQICSRRVTEGALLCRHSRASTAVPLGPLCLLGLPLLPPAAA